MARNIMNLFDATLSPLVYYQNAISHPRGLCFTYITIFNNKKKLLYNAKGVFFS